MSTWSEASSIASQLAKRATKKRQTPAPIPPRLLCHLRRWRDRRLIATCFVEFNGKPGCFGEEGFPEWREARRTRRPGHTTYPAPYRGNLVDDLGGRRVPADVARSPSGNLWAPHPDYLRGAAAAIGQKGRYVSVVESVVDSGTTADKNKKPNLISGRSGRIRTSLQFLHVFSMLQSPPWATGVTSRGASEVPCFFVAWLIW